MKGQTAKTWEASLLGPPPNVAVFVNTKRIMLSVFSAPEYSLGDDFGYFKSQLSSLQILIPQILKTKLSDLGPNFRVPVFLFEGAHDPYCRPSLVTAYFEKINAPRKEFVLFDKSGHFPFFEQRKRFAEELFQRVLPLASRGRSIQ